MAFIKNLTSGRDALQMNLWGLHVNILPGYIAEVACTEEEAKVKCPDLNVLEQKGKIIFVQDPNDEKAIRLKEAALRAKDAGNKGVHIVDARNVPETGTPIPTTQTIKKKIDGEDVGIGAVVNQNNIIGIKAPEGENEIQPTQGHPAEVYADGNRVGAVIRVKDTGDMPVEEVETYKVIGEKSASGAGVLKVITQDDLNNHVDTVNTSKRAPKIAQHIIRCIGTNRHGEPCKKDAIEGYDYCNTHMPADLRARYKNQE